MRNVQRYRLYVTETCKRTETLKLLPLGHCTTFLHCLTEMKIKLAARKKEKERGEKL